MTKCTYSGGPRVPYVNLLRSNKEVRGVSMSDEVSYGHAPSLTPPPRIQQQLLLRYNLHKFQKCHDQETITWIESCVLTYKNNFYWLQLLLINKFGIIVKFREACIHACKYTYNILCTQSLVPQMSSKYMCIASKLRTLRRSIWCHFVLTIIRTFV